jgi:hypothetical protein
VDESEFIDGLAFEELRKQYAQERELRLHEARRSFSKEEKGLRRDLETGIEDDRRHTEVLNLALNLFTNRDSRPYRLGYRFVHGSPLLELEVPNFDFLVANVDAEGPVAILGEAKGSVSNPARTVAQTRDRERTARDNIDHIKERYLRTEADLRVEVVLAIPAIGAQRVIEAIEDSGGGIIPWMTDKGENLVNLELPRSIKGKLRGSMMHSDRALNKALEKARSTDRGFDIFPQSPPLHEAQDARHPCEKGRPTLLGGQGRAIQAPEQRAVLHERRRDLRPRGRDHRDGLRGGHPQGRRWQVRPLDEMGQQAVDGSGAPEDMDRP